MLNHRPQLLLLIFVSGTMAARAQPLNVKSYQSFDLNTATNIRAIEVLNDSLIWFAGSNGKFGFTENSGYTWTIDSLHKDDLIPEFRGIALTNDHTIFLTNTGSPAYIWMSDDIGVTWNVVYENHDDDIFLDAIKFTDAKNGIVLGDPIRDCFQVFITADSGKTWKPVGCSTSSAALGGEACFASSNSSLDAIGKSVWFGTGGLHARIFSSIDGGLHWKATGAPIVEGGDLTGIFSLDFYDRYSGVIAGGDYSDKNSTIQTLAITHDEGKTWLSIEEENAPPMVSCIQFQPNAGGKIMVATCLAGVYFSEDGGLHWNRMMNEFGKSITDNFYTIRFSSSGKVAWLAGANGKFARIEFK